MLPPVLPAGIPGAPPRRLYLRCDTALPCAGNDLQIQGAALLIQDGRIAAFGPATSFAPPSDAETLDLPGCTVLPGLIDGHVHLMYRSGETVHEHARSFTDEQLLVRAAGHARHLL